jgi:hypothetical protein
MKIIRAIPLIPWWALYCAFDMHDKAYETRTLRGWVIVRHKPFAYVTGWLFWVAVLAGVRVIL